jgi:hypothetical protein
MIAEGEDVTTLPGIGEDLASKIKEIVETGRASVLEEHRKNVPATLTTLLKIPGLGPKRVQTLYHKLGVRTLSGPCKGSERRPSSISLRSYKPGQLRRSVSSWRLRPNMPRPTIRT